MGQDAGQTSEFAVPPGVAPGKPIETAPAKILTALLRHHPRPCPTIDMLSTWLGDANGRVDGDDLLHLVRSLQKAGSVAFLERKSGGTSELRLERIHLTAAGHARASSDGPATAIEVTQTARVPDPLQLVRPFDQRVGIGGVTTEWKSTGPAGGGDSSSGHSDLIRELLESKRPVATPRLDEVPVDDPPVQTDEAPDDPRGLPLELTHEQPVTDPNLQAMAPEGSNHLEGESPAAAASLPLPAVRSVPESVDEHLSPARTPMAPGLGDLEARYPKVCQLLRREAQVIEAARVLELNGLPDLAEQAIEKLSFTPFELEVVGLLRELGVADGVGPRDESNRPTK